MRGTGTSSGNCCGGFAGGDRSHRGRSDDTTQPRDHPDSARGRASDHCGVRAGLLVGGRRRPVGHVPILASGALALGTIGLEDRVERLRRVDIQQFVVWQHALVFPAESHLASLPIVDHPVVLQEITSHQCMIGLTARFKMHARKPPIQSPIKLWQKICAACMFTSNLPPAPE